MNRILLLIAFLVSTLASQAQEMWGINNSNFSGTMGIYLNPSTIVSAPYKNDLLILGADVFLQNNYFYFRAKDQVIPRIATGSINDNTQAYQSNSPVSKYGFANLMLMGPSYARNQGNYAWAIHTAIRSNVDVIHVPYFLPQLFNSPEGLFPGINQELSSMRFSAGHMSWAEVGGTFGWVIKPLAANFLKAAVTVNGLAGIDAAYVKVNSLDFYRPDSTNMNFKTIDAEFAHSLPDGGGGPFRGYGMSTTIGITYIKNLDPNGYRCGNEGNMYKKYKYRIGVSLMDVGYIRFNKQTETVTLKKDNWSWNTANSMTTHSLHELDTALSNRVYGNPTEGVSNDPFNMVTPAALSVQVDYALTRNIYANASIINRMRFMRGEVARPNQLDFSLRYEVKNFEISTNVSIFEYRSTASGVALRYMIFTVGTDRLGPYTGKMNVKSFDLFFGIRLNSCELFFRKKKQHICAAYAD